MRGGLFRLVSSGNHTTRDRQFEHAATRFCASGCISPLTEFSLLITLRPRIQGTVIRRADGPPTPGTPQSRLTEPVGFHRDIEEASFHTSWPALPVRVRVTPEAASGRDDAQGMLFPNLVRTPLSRGMRYERAAPAGVKVKWGARNNKDAREFPALKI